MTTTVLRPNGTNVSTSVTLTGGASVHAVTSDESDASYATIGSGGDFNISSDSLSLATGEVLKSFQFFVRLGAGGGGVIVEAALNSAWSVSQSFTSIGSLATLSGPLTATNTMTPASLAVYRTSGTPAIHELYTEVVTVALPVTAIAAITDPYTASTSIPFSWTNTLDADGGPQSHYQWRVFTDAQYGAGSFDPATSTAEQSPAAVVSSATSATTAPLPPDDTYRLYLRVAQTVNGAYHWSAWDEFDQFTIDVDTANVTVAATPNHTAGKIAVVVSRVEITSAWEFMEVERTIDAGVTWAPVRLASFVDATASANSFAVDDHEAPNGATVTYRARATWYSSEFPITGAWVSSSSTSWASDDEWIKAVYNPTLNIKIKGVSFAADSRSTRAGVFSIVGSSIPVVVDDVLTTAGGTITFRTRGRAEALALDDLLKRRLLLNLRPESAIGPGRDGFQHMMILNPSEVWERQRYAGADITEKLVSISFAPSASPPDETAGSV